MARTNFTRLNGRQMAQTLAAKFVPLGDSLRDLLSKFGLRRYLVHVVKTKWTGGRRGNGTENVVYDEMILPTPKVLDMQGVAEVLQQVGLDEVGSIKLSKISGRYTDEFLRGLDEEGNGPAADENLYYEIEFPRADGLPGDRRRFQLSGAPMYFAGRLYWEVNLTRAHEDRDRRGVPR